MPRDIRKARQTGKSFWGRGLSPGEALLNVIPKLPRDPSTKLGEKSFTGRNFRLGNGTVLAPDPFLSVPAKHSWEPGGFQARLHLHLCKGDYVRVSIPEEGIS